MNLTWSLKLFSDPHFNQVSMELGESQLQR